MPHNTHLTFDALVSFSTYETVASYPPNWTSLNYNTYFLLNNPAKAKKVADKVNDRIKELSGKVFYQHYLQPLWDIHLNRLRLGVESKGDLKKLFLFSAVAILILLIACINFMNLTIARSSIRIKEVGIRKTLGALKTQLAWQFLSEAMLYAVLSVGIAMLLIYFSLPVFNQLLDTQISFSVRQHPEYIFAVLVLIIVIGLLAGRISGISAFPIQSYSTAQCLVIAEWSSFFVWKSLGGWPISGVSNSDYFYSGDLSSDEIYAK